MQLREKELVLESVRCQPDHEKDQEIQRLRLALEERERTEATRAVLCSSLAEEADKLRSQLSATVKVCQELLVKLGKEKEEEGETQTAAQHTTKEVCSCTPGLDSPQLDPNAPHACGFALTLNYYLTPIYHR